MPNKLSQFWQELKRRNVVRVATVYAGAAFVILELVDILAPSLGLPGWTLNLVLILLIVGFFITVIVSWIYDIHPEGGIVKTEPIHKLKLEDIPKSSKGWKIASYISFVVIVGLIVLNVIPRSGKKEILDKSIAVLPFRNDSPDQERMYFINGTMEAILDNLCKIEDLRVVSRNSVEQYRDNPRSTPIVAEEMDVSYVLEGSGHRDEDNVRLFIQLLDGKKDQHLWSKSYNANIEEIFSVQSEIAQLVAEEIKAVITPAEKDLIEKIPTPNLTAYDFYQRGRDEQEKYWLDRNRKALERAENLYHKALEYDSTFALAYTGLARVYWDKHGVATALTENYLDSMLILADIALSFDDQIAEAYIIKGQYFQNHNQKEQAIKEFDKAIKLNPNNYFAYWAKGDLYYLDDNVKTIDNLLKAALLHRGSFLPRIYRNLSFAYLNAGFKEVSYDYLEEALKLDTDSVVYYIALVNLEHGISNYENAIKFGEKLYLIDSTYNHNWIMHLMGYSHMVLGHREKSLEYLKKREQILKNRNSSDSSASSRLGYAYLMNGFEEEAKYHLDAGIERLIKTLEMGQHVLSREMDTYYGLAASYAAMGDKDKAYENLRSMIQFERMSLWISGNIKDDPLFDSIRDEPEFQQIVRDVEAKYQAEHERVRQWLEENDLL
jgi:TolB-like protein/Tfp pilus assembly protein PilF